MGLTESNSKIMQVEDKYKLIRRYNSECYGDLTVIQSRENQLMYALKQLITESDFIIKIIEQRQQMKHRSLVALQNYWFRGEQSLCSNLRSVEMLFQYFPRTLDQQLQSRVAQDERGFSDWQVLQILSDCIDCLGYLEDMGFLHLVGSMKGLLYDSSTKSIKIIENQETVIHSHKNKHLNVLGMMSKKMMPLHPLNQPKDVSDICLDQGKVAFQNMFVLGLICLGLCHLRYPLELGIFDKGGYNFEKVQKKLYQIRFKFPKSYSILSWLILESSPKTSYKEASKQISFERRSFTKENDRLSRLIDIQPVQKIGNKKLKKLSYLRQLKFNNSDIPNQF